MQNICFLRGEHEGMVFSWKGRGRKTAPTAIIPSHWPYSKYLQCTRLAGHAVKVLCNAADYNLATVYLSSHLPVWAVIKKSSHVCVSSEQNHTGIERSDIYSIGARYLMALEGIGLVLMHRQRSSWEATLWIRIPNHQVTLGLMTARDWSLRGFWHFQVTISHLSGHKSVYAGHCSNSDSSLEPRNKGMHLILPK